MWIYIAAPLAVIACITLVAEWRLSKLRWQPEYEPTESPTATCGIFGDGGGYGIFGPQPQMDWMAEEDSNRNAADYHWRRSRARWRRMSLIRWIQDAAERRIRRAEQREGQLANYLSISALHDTQVAILEELREARFDRNAEALRRARAEREAGLGTLSGDWNGPVQ